MVSIEGRAMKEIRTFGPFRFDPATGEIWRGDVIIRLANQPARMLTILTGRPGELITREELRRALWSSDTFVDFDACLNHCARKIRTALGDSSDSPAYLQTVPRRGYRFIGSLGGERPDSLPTAIVGRENRRARIGRTAAALCLGLASGLVLGHVAEASPWHGQMVHWLHQRLGTLPGICYWP
jgi:DNA-binding winged helix-turn-helix (wHTH) protein